MSWKVSARLNPELMRSLRASLPHRRALFVAVFTFVILAAGGWLLWAKTEPMNYQIAGEPMLSAAELRARHWLAFGSEAFVALTVVLFALLFLLGPAMAGLSFVQERLRGTAIFQQMSLLSPFTLAAGKFWGSGAPAFFVAALILPFALVAAMLSDMSMRVILQLYLFLFVGAWCWQAVGLYVSAALSGPAEKPLRGGLLVGPLVAVFAGISALVFSQFFMVDYDAIMRARELSQVNEIKSYDYEYNHWIEQGHYWWRFYGARIPVWTVVPGLMAFAGACAFVGAVRRIKVWQLIPVSPRGAWLFYFSAEALLVGLLWGRYIDDVKPIERLQIYLLLNAVVLALLVGGSALTRGRLREWWSAERDPLALFRRAEIAGALKTFLFALAVSTAGLCALWWSYHVDPSGNRFDYQLIWQLIPLVIGYVLTIAGLAAFVQFCAMFRFRIGGWAGVMLAVVFYLFMGLAGLMFDNINNTPALINPIVYAEALVRGDYFMDSRFYMRYESVYETDEWGQDHQNSKPVVPADYDVYYSGADYDVDDARARGLMAQGGLALFCFVLAGWKWRRTRAEMSETADTGAMVTA